MISRVRPNVDRDDFSYGKCIETLPDVFFANEERKAVVRDRDAPAERLTEAVDGCPMGAIVLVDADGLIVYP